jgi:tetratricopeptide (TPR) repeat protein
MSRPRTSASRTRHLGERVEAPSARAGADAELESARRLAVVRDALASRDPSRVDPETQAILLRNLAAARFEAGRRDEALALARRVIALGVLRDLGHHEVARVLAARGALREAADEERLAARAAPAERRAFFYWSEACHREHAGEIDAALDALRKAIRWATDAGRPLFRAHAAVLRLERGEATPGLARTIAALEASPQRDGYGRLLLARIGWQLGDRARAATHARAFLRRHASSDRGVLDTLGHELAHARRLARSTAAS